MMPEEKDNPRKENGELSLEEQLQSLLRGLPVKPTDEDTLNEKEPATETPQAELAAPPPPVKETPPAPQQIQPLPMPAEMKADPPAQSTPLADPLGRDTVHKPLTDSATSPLTEELAALFGGAPQTPGTTPTGRGIPPAPIPPNIPPRGAVAGKPPVSETVTRSPAPTSPHLVVETVFPSATEAFPASPGVELAFKDVVIKGPKPVRPFLGLRMLQKHIISVSIEGANLRIVTLAGNSIETWASVPVDTQFLREGYIVNVPGMGEAISKVLQSLNIGPGNVVCSFTSLGSITRILQLPQSAKKELPNIIPRELRRASVNIDNYTLYWRILPIKQGSLQVFILGVPKEPMVAMLEALRITKLKPTDIELKPLALARAVNKKDAIIAHGERDSLELTLVIEGVPSLIRSIYLGLETTPDQVVSRLIEELESTIYFYNSNHREKPLDPQIPVYITGEIAGFQNLIGKGQIPVLDRNIAPLEPPLKLPDGFPTAIFMVNIGLLLKKT
ncbi:MAG: hypothetical protein Q7R34_16665 [Dehalococcoidia bacterium]|nr:hypothetical protein [Dehalococcoidia bacterium]